MARSRSSSGGGGGIRRSTSSSFGSKPAAAPTRTQERTQQHAPPPAVAPQHAPAAHQQPSQHAAPAAPAAAPGGGGLLSGLAGTVMQGMAFGGGSEVARRAIDGVMGPRTVVHEHQNGEAVQPMPAAQGEAVMQALDTGSAQTNRKVEQQCGDEVLQFQKCLTDNNNNFQTCSFYFDVLNQCKKSVQDNAQWQ